MTTNNQPALQPPESPRIVSGDESLDIYDIMQRFRNDGSCEYIIEEALRNLADTRTHPQACLKCGHYNETDPRGRCISIYYDAGGSLCYCGCKCEYARARVSDGVVATVDADQIVREWIADCSDRLQSGETMSLPKGALTDLVKRIAAAAPAPIAAPVKEHKRHVLSGCNEFLCLPEVNPHHYEIVPDAATQDERPRKVFDAGFSPQSPAINAAEEIREWIGITGLVDGNGVKEVAAIIQKHYESETTSKAED